MCMFPLTWQKVRGLLIPDTFCTFLVRKLRWRLGLKFCDYPSWILAINFSLLCHVSVLSFILNFIFNLLTLSICSFIINHLKYLLKRNDYKIVSNSRVAKRVGPGTKLPRFKSQLYNLGGLWLWGHLMPQCPQLWNGNNINMCPVGFKDLVT